MIIGTDIDGTLNLFHEILIEAGEEFTRKYLSREPEVRLESYSMRKIFGWSEREYLLFWGMYSHYCYALSQIRDHASTVLREIKKSGDTIYVITARENTKEVQSITETWLKGHNIRYDGMFMGRSDKEVLCKDLGIDLFIEDNLDICKRVEPYSNVLCMENFYNKNYTGNLVSSWGDVFEKYEELKRG